MILPAPHPSFAWQSTARGAALVCEPLSRIAPHFFTARSWALGQPRPEDEPQAWREIRQAFPEAPPRLAHMRQVHGATCVDASAELSTELPTGDIVASRDAGIAVAVQVADCVPLLLADRRTGAVAAVHGGWRGLAADVPGVAMRFLRDRYGTRPDDVVAAAGPSIGACCYQVGRDVYDAMAAIGVGAETLGRWLRAVPAALAANPPYAGAPAASMHDRWFFDGWAVTRDLLIAAGVDEQSIYQCELCTASHRDVFCSYRRDGAPAGRLAGAIRPASR